LFSFGLIVGLSKFCRAPFLALISNNEGPFTTFNKSIFLITSSFVSALNTELQPQAFAIRGISICKPVVNCPPTESWAPLLNIICLKFQVFGNI